MSVSIRSNSASLRAQRILGRTSDQLSATLQRLSSGERINRASDDAGGSEILRMESQRLISPMRPSGRSPTYLAA